MSTPSMLIATGTGEIVFTFWIGASLVSSSLAKCGNGRAAIVYFYTALPLIGLALAQGAIFVGPKEVDVWK